MRLSLRLCATAAALCLLTAPVLGQSASGAATGGASKGSGSAGATVGSGGSAASGGTAASSLGTAGISSGAAGTSSSLGVGGSAAGERATAKSKLNPNATNAHARASANEGGGTWSRSMTHTKVHKGEVQTRTRSMAHQKGGPPVKSTVRSSSGLPQ